MKGWLASLVVGAIALLIGVAIGGLGPRAQVRALEAQLEETKECSSNVGSDIARVFEGKAWRDAEAPRDRVVLPEGKEDAVRTAVEEDGGTVDIRFDDTDPATDIEGSLDKAREVMDLRMTQARAALEQDAEPTEEQWASIDQALDEMNADLQTLADGFASSFQDGEPNRRESMEFAADTLDVLMKAEDQLRGSLEPEQLDALQEESLDPTAYVDSSIIDALQAMGR